MTVSPMPSSGNSSKFKIVTKQGEFMLTLSFTLRTKVWKLADSAVELDAAEQLAEAVVSRHNPKFPLKAIYVFGEHNSEASLPATVNKLRKLGF